MPNSIRAPSGRSGPRATRAENWSRTAPGAASVSGRVNAATRWVPHARPWRVSTPTASRTRCDSGFVRPMPSRSAASSNTTRVGRTGTTRSGRSRQWPQLSRRSCSLRLVEVLDQLGERRGRAREAVNLDVVAGLGEVHLLRVDDHDPPAPAQRQRPHDGAQQQRLAGPGRSGDEKKRCPPQVQDGATVGRFPGGTVTVSSQRRRGGGSLANQSDASSTSDQRPPSAGCNSHHCAPAARAIRSAARSTSVVDQPGGERNECRAVGQRPPTARHGAAANPAHR